MPCRGQSSSLRAALTWLQLRASRLAVGAAAAGLAVCLCAAPATAQSSTVPLVDVTTQAMAPPAPADLLGLSFEASTIPRIAGYAGKGNFTTLLTSLGPGILRFSGGSVDADTAFLPTGGTPPPWAQTLITPSQLGALASLGRATGWRIVLGVGLGHYDPSAAAQFVQAAQNIMGSTLAAVEVGNESDDFPNQGLRPQGWGYADYIAEYRAYRAAIAAAAPSVPVEGPDLVLSWSGIDWATSFATDMAPSTLGVHLYPVNGAACTGVAPTISDLFSTTTVSTESARLTKLLAGVGPSGIPVRLSEANDVSCGGAPGVSNTTASALWTVGFVARIIQHGVRGINFHDQPNLCMGYSSLCVASNSDHLVGHVTALPQWYGLMLAAHLRGSTPVITNVQASPASDAYAFINAQHQYQVLLVNHSNAPMQLKVHVPVTSGSASILTLSGPSLAATTGTTLGGASVAADGSLAVPSALPSQGIVNGSAMVSLAPASAELLTITGTTPGSGPTTGPAAGPTTAPGTAPASTPPVAAIPTPAPTGVPPIGRKGNGPRQVRAPSVRIAGARLLIRTYKPGLYKIIVRRDHPAARVSIIRPLRYGASWLQLPSRLRRPARRRRASIASVKGA